MKNIKQRLGLWMVTMLLSLVAFAQPPQPPRFNPATFEADMEQFITTEVGDTSNDAASLKTIKECDKIEVEMKKIQQEYHLKFCKVLSPGKVLAVIKAEEKFHRQAFKRMARRKTR